MRLEEAIYTTNSAIANERRMLTLIKSQRTKTVLKSIENNPEKVNEFVILFNDKNVDVLRAWLNKLIDPELGELGVRDLRKLARIQSIPYYYRLSKIELIQEIQSAKNKDKDRTNHGPTLSNGEVDTGGGDRREKIQKLEHTA